MIRVHIYINLPDMSCRHTCMCAGSFRYYSKSGGEMKLNITMKRHGYSWINPKFRTHLRCVHSGHYSDNLCQKLPGDEFPAEIWHVTGTGFNWVRAHSQNFVLVLGMRPRGGRHSNIKWIRVYGSHFQRLGHSVRTQSQKMRGHWVRSQILVQN